MSGQSRKVSLAAEISDHSCGFWSLFLCVVGSQFLSCGDTASYIAAKYVDVQATVSLCKQRRQWQQLRWLHSASQSGDDDGRVPEHCPGRVLRCEELKSFVLFDGNKSCPLNVSGAADILGYDFRGTPDAVLVLRASWRWPQAALRVVFVVRKQLLVISDANYQAMVTLLLANIHSSRLKPIVILTDLNEAYTFFWLDGHTLYYTQVDSAPLAWGLFDAILGNERTSAKAEVVPCEGVEVVPPPVKRQRLIFEPRGTQDVADLSSLAAFMEPSDVPVCALAQRLQSLNASCCSCT
ncbi:hypothetical protein JKP88DRAFT_245190 [Tribonema minus]|uniref:Uncharacterized protein n=1 Tax=Tribonema minus TaxID=303371 RepID=A0A836CH38_9STRA|nr:hypothetical protein JKP88DRAFT_245190 [Tribonema minus]